MALRRAARLAAVTLLALASIAACGGTSSQGGGGSVTTVDMVAFQPPSLGDFLPPIIKARHLDTKHGLDLKVSYRTPDAYNLEFASGDFPLGGSASLLSEGVRWQRGDHTTFLFSEYDFWTAIATKRADIRTARDLEGKTLAASTVTTNYALFRWFLGHAGVDMSKVQVKNYTPAGAVAALEAGQVDAIDVTEPAYSTLIARDHDVRTVKLDYSLWKKAYGTDAIPFLGVAAAPSWAQSHKQTVQRLYDTYRDAVAWVHGHPGEAGAIIAKTIPGGDPKVIQSLIEHNDRLRLRLSPAGQVRRGIEAAFDAGVSMGYLKSKPGDAFVYTGLKSS